MAITTGQAAPDFKLFNTEKKEISLSDYKGKNLVILFFPLAFTGEPVQQSYAALEIIIIFIHL
jgi:peroxiredoxin